MTADEMQDILCCLTFEFELCLAHHKMFPPTPMDMARHNKEVISGCLMSVSSTTNAASVAPDSNSYFMR